MIATEPVRSTSPLCLGRRRLLALGLSMTVATATCAGPPRLIPPGGSEPPAPEGWFTMDDGARLPFRTWRPASGSPWRVMLALHGVDDSRDAFEYAGPRFAEAGILIYAPDQRGFGAAPGRGEWAGADRMTRDAAAMLRQLGAWHPNAPLVALGESMGGAVLMNLATWPDAPSVAATVLAAPAVWGREEMAVLLRAGLWVVSHTMADVSVTGGGPIHVWATDNRAALRRLSGDPLTLRVTKFKTVAGLVDLMDHALAAAPRQRAPTLCLYGAHDALVPDHAMAAAWRGMRRSGAVRLAYYPAGYHLLLRDLNRALPIGDTLAWLNDPSLPVLPSGADIAADLWIKDRW